MNISQPIKLLVSISMPLLAGFLGSLFTMPAIDSWYRLLERPAFAPPDFVFGPVWTTLYIMMGVAAYLVWKDGLSSGRVRMATLIFLLQLSLNSAWSIFFFGLQSPISGLYIIGALWTAIVLNIILFARVSRVAAWLLVPYLLWVSFASYLNYSIWMLN